MIWETRRLGVALRPIGLVWACALVAIAGGCGGGGDGSPVPPPDLSGVWAGSWQGDDPSPGGLGPVSGTWEVEITQGATSASGPGVLLGDIDCMDGQMQTNAGAQNAVTGSLARTPCATVNWMLTALNVAAGSASGSWTNSGTGGGGTLSGVRIAQLGGPRVHFMHPPGAKPGAIVTVSGQMLSGLSTGDGLVINQTSQPTLLSADATRIVARVPSGVSSGPVKVTTAAGVAHSPRSFTTDVTSPPVVLGGSSAQGVAPAALAVSPDGRKFYIVDRGVSTVRVVRTSTLIDLTPTPVAVSGIPRSVVVSPDGKRIYVASANLGVLVMDAASGTGLDTISLSSINDGGRDNPQGLAISPDGTLLLVSEGADAGSVRLFRVADKQLLRSFSFAIGVAPLGVAFSPDGALIFVAAADLNPATTGSLQVFDASTGAPIDNEAMGVLPTALAVAPDGNLVYVTNKDSGTVSVYNTQSLAVAMIVPVGTAPTGIAISPDGARVYVANRGSDNVSVFDATNGAQAMGSPLSVGAAPIAVAINPQGTTAYVSNVMTSPVVVAIGGMRTLTVALGGSGIGRVRSDLPGIDCGTQCQAQFPVNTAVTLMPTAAGGSFFGGWSGDAGCGSAVTLTSNLNCRATFTSNSPPPSESIPPVNVGCFIATAAYGSSMAEEVMTLRLFRDDYLMKSGGGRGFVRLYYRYSPAVADYIRERDSLRAAVRLGLWPLVRVIKDPALGLGAVLFMGLLLVLRRDGGST